jgi:hypothetical protein
MSAASMWWIWRGTPPVSLATVSKAPVAASSSMFCAARHACEGEKKQKREKFEKRRKGKKNQLSVVFQGVGFGLTGWS